MIQVEILWYALFWLHWWGLHHSFPILLLDHSICRCESPKNFRRGILDSLFGCVRLNSLSIARDILIVKELPGLEVDTLISILSNDELPAAHFSDRSKVEKDYSLFFCFSLTHISLCSGSIVDWIGNKAEQLWVRWMKHLMQIAFPGSKVFMTTDLLHFIAWFSLGGHGQARRASSSADKLSL